jgi:GntR family carbon starvation induced transcriptional regulator
MIKAAQATDETRTLTESAYRLIRSDILSGLVAPKDKLHISDLSQRHGTSASAIREALSRLVSEGLATMEEQKGFRVAPMSVREFREITDLRVMLETEALRHALALGGDEWESNIVATYYRLARAEERLASGDNESISDWEMRHRDFHDALVGACDSQWLLRLRSSLYDHSRRYRKRSLLGGPLRRDSSVEHQMLQTTALARETEKACALIAQHFLKTYETYRANVEVS